MAVTGSMWQLRVLSGWYGVYVADAGFTRRLQEGCHVASLTATCGPQLPRRPRNYREIAMYTSHAISRKSSHIYVAFTGRLYAWRFDKGMKGLTYTKSCLIWISHVNHYCEKSNNPLRGSPFNSFRVQTLTLQWQDRIVLHNTTHIRIQNRI